MNRKDDQITKLKEEISDLKDKMQYLESHIDGVDQYERCDTIIIVSGPLIPEVWTSPLPTEINHYLEAQQPIFEARPGWGLHLNEASTLH
ncbi:hypothetical protein E2C01_033083 [Portunus trituberculatus]|uniref:Uncharacterized protein n=1 Tax=Portunus trituberculatus TaxID=210409 RepID=A0A5B7F4Q1_PORTR|nr:hypothetical protein [Portunus trituberculatus]